jgi:hypothetical protein
MAYIMDGDFCRYGSNAACSVEFIAAYTLEITIRIISGENRTEPFSPSCEKGFLVLEKPLMFVFAFAEIEQLICQAPTV